jgi:methyl-accepting chemotaxis protein
MENKTYKRRRIRIVKMEFQRDFILKFCAIIIFSALVISAIVYILSMSSATTVFENSRLEIKRTADFILPLLILSSLVAIIAAGAVTIIVTLFISHRIAGPLYRMEKDIADVTNGNLGLNIRVREKDELQNLAKSLDQMVKSIRNTVVEVKNELADISDATLSDKDKPRLGKAKNLLKKFKC